MAGLTPLGLDGKEAPESFMIFPVFFFKTIILDLLSIALVTSL